MLDLATRLAERAADVLGPAPAGLVGRPADGHAAQPDDLEAPLLEHAHLVGRLEALEDRAGVVGVRHQMAPAPSACAAATSLHVIPDAAKRRSGTCRTQRLSAFMHEGDLISDVGRSQLSGAAAPPAGMT